MKCQFCSNENADIPITDSETQQEILICDECDKLMYFKIPKKIKDIKGYNELSIQELEKKVDEFVDNEIEYLKLRSLGLED